MRLDKHASLLALVCFLLPFALLLGGCGAASVATASVEGTALTGRLLGGQQPIAGAVLSLYAAGLGGTGLGASSLLTVPVLSDSNGNFTVSYDYTCPAMTTQVYLIARGGNPGLPGVANNAASVLMAPLGDCGNLNPSSFITINEVTTVASAWALAQFAPAGVSSGAMFGGSATNATGLRNAFLVANNLVNVSTGAAGGASLPPGAALEASKLYTLADVLATCVNSNGGTACTPLFSAATNTAGPNTTAPSNTLDAALQIVRNPGLRVAAVYNAGAPQGPFQPTLATAPNDWTMTISYIGGGLFMPTAVGVDSSGSVWAANYFGGYASKFSAAGVAASAAGFYDPNLYESFGLAIDGNDAVWITDEESSSSVNKGDGTITKFSASGALLSGSGISAGNIYYPYAIAADSNGDIWVADYGHVGSTATLLDNNGNSLSGSSGFAAAIPFPVGVALDGQHNAWFAGEQVAGEITPAGVGTAYTCCNSPASVALDGSANVWLADRLANGLVELTPGGVVTQRLASPAGGLERPQTVITDAAGNVWVTNYLGNTISGFTGGPVSTAISPGTGFGVDPMLSEPFGLAIDAAGNMWVSNRDPNYNSLTEFVGLASPTKSPRLGLPTAP